MRQHITPPNLVTSASIAAGFIAMLVAPTHLALATVLVLLAALFDGVDGALARRAGGDRTFGAQLDSLADLLCFCVAPAFILYQALDAPVLGAVTSVVFVLAGAWRLARFPLVKQQGHFIGLPTPAAGGVLMLLILWTPVWMAVSSAMVLSALMVSALRCPMVLSLRTHDLPPSSLPHVDGRRPHRHTRLVRRVLARTHRRRSAGPRRPVRR